MNSKIYFVIGIIALLVSVRMLFRKGELHFKLLKSLYPEKLEGVKSYFWLTLSYKYYALGLSNILWLAFPVYIPIKKDFKESDKKIQQDLVKNNLYTAIAWGIYILWWIIGAFVIDLR
jgi:hypothetical protein